MVGCFQKTTTKIEFLTIISITDALMKLYQNGNTIKRMQFWIAFVLQVYITVCVFWSSVSWSVFLSTFKRYTFLSVVKTFADTRSRLLGPCAVLFQR